MVKRTKKKSSIIPAKTQWISLNSFFIVPRKSAPSRKGSGAHHFGALGLESPGQTSRVLKEAATAEGQIDVVLAERAVTVLVTVGEVDASTGDGMGLLLGLTTCTIGSMAGVTNEGITI